MPGPIKQFAKQTNYFLSNCLLPEFPWRHNISYQSIANFYSQGFQNLNHTKLKQSNVIRIAESSLGVSRLKALLYKILTFQKSCR